MAVETPKPVELTEPFIDPPVPTPGCDVCGALFRQLKEAKSPGSPAHSPSWASSLAVEIRRHPHVEVDR
jgi:hypothetical protein